MTQSYQDWLNEDASHLALEAEVEEHARLADMHECAAPEEDVEGCNCNRCIKARELSAAN
jgi:hypothetical protein